VFFLVKERAPLPLLGAQCDGGFSILLRGRALVLYLLATLSACLGLILKVNVWFISRVFIGSHNVNWMSARLFITYNNVLLLPESVGSLLGELRLLF